MKDVWYWETKPASVFSVNTEVEVVGKCVFSIPDDAVFDCVPDVQRSTRLILPPHSACMRGSLGLLTQRRFSPFLSQLLMFLDPPPIAARCTTSLKSALCVGPQWFQLCLYFQGAGQEKLGIYIKSVVKGGAADVVGSHREGKAALWQKPGTRLTPPVLSVFTRTAAWLQGTSC